MTEIPLIIGAIITAFISIWAWRDGYKEGYNAAQEENRE